MRVMTMFVIMAVAFVMMRVPEDGKFLQQEKSQQTRQQRRKQRMNIGLRLESLG